MAELFELRIERALQERSLSLFDANFDSLYRKEYPRGLNLNPNSETHGKLVRMLLTMVAKSRRTMESRYSDWHTVADMLNIYIPLSEKEKAEKDRDSRTPQSVVVPVMFANLDTVLTFLAAAFLDRPIFKYEPVGPEDLRGTLLLQGVIDNHARRFGFELPLNTLWRDGLAYNMGVVAPVWTSRRGRRFVNTPSFEFSPFGAFRQGSQRLIEEGIVYEGNQLLTISPFHFYPDPNVPVDRLQEGLFVAWSTRTNRVDLIEDELSKSGRFNAQYLKLIDGRSLFYDPGIDSNWRIGSVKKTEALEEVDLLYIYAKVIPFEWGLSERRTPEKWFFVIAGDRLLLAAHPMDLLHDLYPVVACSPDYDGHTLFPLSRMERLKELQRLIDFFMNSRVASVKKSLNDLWLVDPLLVDQYDLLHPEEGFIVRARKKAWGKGRLDDGLKQFRAQDTTGGHVNDLSLLLGFAERASGATEQLQGLRRRTSERVTATEFSGLSTNAFGRLERLARITGAQSMDPLARMLAFHTQQFKSLPEWIRIVGGLDEDLKKLFGEGERVQAQPEDLLVDIDVTPHTGELPGSGDPGLQLQLWQQAAASPIASRLDLVKMFLAAARAAGFKNVTDFLLSGQAAPQVRVEDEETVQRQVQAGDLVPLSEGA